ncbi:MAG: ABC transporter ATP-binding protein [Nitrospirae bacterium]|jgi:ABC-type cobalamin/Fe3+-siderophores transport system ATPase subunit|nr:ABC transporter ATP-binding protein [Nitrospirota bacterium]
MFSVHNYPILELNNVSFSYERGNNFIYNLNFSAGNGEFIGFLGANGSGKSTILKLASGILKPSHGEIKLWGKSLQNYSNKDRAKLLCYLPQLLDINVPFTVRELVKMGLYPYDIPPLMTIEEAIALVGLQEKSESYITTLSGGERRRVFIAMILVQGAGLLLLDEPLANLDIKYQIELLRLLRELKEKKNISILMALHDINIALHFEKVLLIKDGTMLGMGNPETVLTGNLLSKAFDVNIEIRKHDSGRSYVSYEDTN